MTAPMNVPAWSQEQRAAFYYQMAAVQKDEVLGVLLALFLGSFGLHHFYLKQNGLGILYLLFFWTGIPGFLGFVEAFFMPGRVARFNAEQAALIAGSLGPAQGAAPPPGPGSALAAPCPRCGTVLAPGSRFCSSCGAPSAA